MTKKLPAVIFFGSGPVAAKSLELLFEWQKIVTVVTKTSPSHHKEKAPVEELANKLGIKTVYANNKAELDNLVINSKIPKTKLGIVIDYGVIISQKTIDYFNMGIVNSHFSMLPEWRGADPITYSLLSGQEFTGVSLMLIDKGMDTGPILTNKKLNINPQADNFDLTDSLIELSNSLLKETLPGYLTGSIQPKIQPTDKIVTYSSIITKNSGLIMPNKTATELSREVKAFIGWPNSRLNYNNLWLTVTKAEPSSITLDPGKLVYQNNQLLYGCKNGSLNIIELKPAGKKNMSAHSFINGYAHIIS